MNNNFRNISILSASLLIAASFALVNPALAQTTAPSATLRPGQTLRLDTLKSTGALRIDQRVKSLNNLTTRINNAKNLTTDEKNQFNSQVQTNITGLNDLKTKLAAETDINAAKADVQSIYTGFRIYAVFIPKTHMLLASDIGQKAIDRLNARVTKLQSRIADAQRAGKDVTAVNTMLSDMQAKLADAKKQRDDAVSKVTPLTPASYPGSSAILQAARASFKTGTQDLKTAWQDDKNIRAALKAMGLPKASSASPSASASI